MTIYIFVWLLVVLTLSLLLIHLRHSRRIATEIKEGAADARGILDSSNEGIIVTNGSGRIINCNQMAETIFGYMTKNIIGKNFLLLLPEEFHQAHQHTMSGPAKNVTGQTHELLARKADGTRFHLSLTVKPARKDGKQVFVGMFRDISALKHAEASNWKNKQLMEFLLNSSPIVFYTCDVGNGYSFTYVSPNVETLFGYKPEKIKDASGFWRRYVHPDDHDQIQLSRLSQCTQGRDEIEYRLKLSEGNYRWISDSHTLVLDENGKPSLLIGRWTDIHERKVAEIELALKKESLRVGLKYAKLVTWAWLINSGEMSWSGQIVKQLGISKKQLTDFDDFCATSHPEDRQTLMKTIRQCLVKNKTLDIEYRVSWPDKSIHWIHLMGELINDESGSPVRMTGVLLDVTTQKKLRLASRPKSKPPVSATKSVKRGFANQICN